MIYVIGLDSDRTFRHFVTQATGAGIEVIPINLRAVALEGDWRLALPDDGLSFISIGEEKYHLDPQGAYYCRIIDLSSVQSELAVAKRWQSLLAALTAWLEHIPGTVINRPGSRADNFSKPLHEYALQSFGLQVPPSLTSSDRDRLAAFARAGKTIVKPASGIRADSRLVEAEEFADFHPSQGPVHLQRYVAGADVRAHVIGDRVCAELIKCPEVDYRQSHEEAEYLPWELPESLNRQIIEATAACGLIFAGWDFKVTPDNQYWCLEANPMPGYDGYDRRLGGTITDALLAVLRGEGVREGVRERQESNPKSIDELRSLPLLSAEQVAEVNATIHQLQDLWIPRGKPPTAFLTLGAASYLDFCGVADFAGDYYSQAEKYNPILEKHFGWLYQLICDRLEQELQAPICFLEDLAMPGFHIWLAPAIFTKPTASVHFDLQYQHFNWPAGENIDFSRTISFTLPIKLPKRGGGLNVWDVNYQEFVNAGDRGLINQVEEMQSLSLQTFYPYQVGNLVIHGGHSLHQIAPVDRVYPTDERIALQGHGIYIGDRWYLYW